jgi:hypothetical protein
MIELTEHQQKAVDAQEQPPVVNASLVEKATTRQVRKKGPYSDVLSGFGSVKPEGR